MVILSSIRNDTMLSYNIHSFIENLQDGLRQILTFWSKKASESKKWAKNILPEVWSPPIWLINDDTFLTVEKGQHTIRLLIFFIEAEYTRVTNVVLLVWRMLTENSFHCNLVSHSIMTLTDTKIHEKSLKHCIVRPTVGSCGRRN